MGPNKPTKTPTKTPICGVWNPEQHHRCILPKGHRTQHGARDDNPGWSDPTSCYACQKAYKRDPSTGLIEPACTCQRCDDCGKLFEPSELRVASTDELAERFGEAARCDQCWRYVTNLSAKGLL